MDLDRTLHGPGALHGQGAWAGVWLSVAPEPIASHRVQALRTALSGSGR